MPSLPENFWQKIAIQFCCFAIYFKNPFCSGSIYLSRFAAFTYRTEIFSSLAAALNSKEFLCFRNLPNKHNGHKYKLCLSSFSHSAIPYGAGSSGTSFFFVNKAVVISAPIYNTYWYAVIYPVTFFSVIIKHEYLPVVRYQSCFKIWCYQLLCSRGRINSVTSLSVQPCHWLATRLPVSVASSLNVSASASGDARFFSMLLRTPAAVASQWQGFTLSDCVHYWSCHGSKEADNIKF